MKQLLITAVLMVLFSCKDERPNNEPNSITDVERPSKTFKVTDTLSNKSNDDEDLPKTPESIGIELKQEELINKKDEREDLMGLVIDEKFVLNASDYIINVNYPLLNESFKPTHANFNEFIKNFYANIPKMESEILENKLICDSIELLNSREERYIDYKVYDVNDQLISVLFYKENLYSGSLHPNYSFDCFNFHLNQGVFMNYQDFFMKDTEIEMVNIINQEILSKIKEGEIYYDCWELSTNDFLNAKNNFVLNDTYLEYYFDDCVICPSYTGTYSIKIPLTELLPILKKFDSNPLVF